MTPLNLCIDIDGTLTEPYYWLDKANEYFGTNLTEEQVTEYEIHRILKVSRQKYDEFYNLYGKELHRTATLRPYTKEIMDDLDKEHNLYYVTAREKRMEEVTVEWINRNNLPCDDLFLLGSHYKVDKARELKCNVFLEDNYDNAIQLSAAGFKVLLLDTNYNRLPLQPGITRVYSWLEVKKIIEYLSLENVA